MRFLPTANFVKSLPLALGLPLVIGAASIGPDDAVSNLSKWAARIGFRDLPPWLYDKGVDKYTIYLCLFTASVYVFVIWISPRVFRLGNAQHPDLSDIPPIGSLLHINSLLESSVSVSTKLISGRVMLRIKNKSEKIIKYRGETAGRINDVPFCQQKVPIEGYISPHEEIWFMSNRLNNLKSNDTLGGQEPSIYGVFEYDIHYGYAENNILSRRMSRGVRIDYWGNLDEKVKGDKEDLPTVVSFYNQIES